MIVIPIANLLAKLSVQEPIKIIGLGKQLMACALSLHPEVEWL
jgi:hypothetical protein